MCGICTGFLGYDTTNSLSVKRCSDDCSYASGLLEAYDNGVSICTYKCPTGTYAYLD